MDQLIDAIRRRIEERVTDLGSDAQAMLCPADASDFSRDEQRLGFPLPSLLKRLYAEIGNGGFGPGYGLIGLTNGVPDDSGQTAPDMYESFRQVDADDPNWQWPERLLPICHWGCAIYSCVDCADPSYRVRIFDPNVHDASDWADSFFEESESLEAWLAAWSSGVDLWHCMYGEKGAITKILSTRPG